jgi:ring-1,2-phenylacetyl-CoA epoxidase subunit PaaE
VAGRAAASASAAARRQHAVFHELRVASVERLTDDAIVIGFDVPAELRDAYRFAPGQHLTIRVPGEGDVRRNYSICSALGEDRLRVAVKRLAGGRFSAYATSALAPGDVLEVMTPTGRFTTVLDPARRRSYAAIAAGSGITPVISIIASALALEPGSRCTLLYGNRTTSSIMFLEELEDLKDRYPERLHIVHVLSREAQESPLLHGRIDPARLSRLLDALAPVDTVDEWFLCGPYPMITAARRTLLEHGADPAQVHLELFHAEGAPLPRAGAEEGAPTAPTGPTAAGGADAGASAVTVVLDGRATTFALDRHGEAILDATLRVRADAPYACKGGVCGTCRAKLLEGQVAMDRNFALEADELADGFVLACQSHPLTGRVRLDFDA